MGTHLTRNPNFSRRGVSMSLMDNTPARCMVPLLISTSCCSSSRSAGLLASTLSAMRCSTGVSEDVACAKARVVERIESATRNPGTFEGHRICAAEYHAAAVATQARFGEGEAMLRKMVYRLAK